MPTEKKTEVVNELEEVLAKSSVTILTDYRGLPGAQMTELHRKFRQLGIDYRVVKNTLARIAVGKANKGELAALLKGQTAMLIGYDDITVPAKTILEYIRSTKSPVTIKGGILGDRLLTAKDVEALATMPRREVLLARVLGGMQLPLYALQGCLNAPLSGILRVLQARAKQLEGGQQSS